MRRNLLMEGYFGEEPFNKEFLGLVLFRPEIEYFIQWKDRLFFAPSGGISLLISSAGSDTEGAVNVQFYTRIYHFLTN
ncbi:MAG: hypothetical protein AAGJ18_04200 [Bacteroidota bacterium]